MKDKNRKPAKNSGKNRNNSKKDKFDDSVLLTNPPINPKKLPHRVYKRGTQGTFAYSPDIAIYIYTADHGIIDLGPYMTSWTLQRNVNSVSSFACTFDNKFSRYDRVIRRMDRIAVFVKRIEWVQIFAGYVTLAPWETVVPGDSTIEAECTLKRLVHTFWDPFASASLKLFPMMNVEGSWQPEDGGAAKAMYEILTTIAHWDSAQIKIQKIPEAWITQAAKLIAKVQSDEYDEFGGELDTVKNVLKDLMTSYGWIPSDGDTGEVTSGKAGGASSGSSDAAQVSDAESQWRKGKTLGKLGSGYLTSIGQTASSKAPPSLQGQALSLRTDAASALKKVMNSGASGALDGNIAVAYLTSTQLDNLTGGSKSTKTDSGSSSFVSSQKTEGWGTMVYLVGDGAAWAQKNSSVMSTNGWTSVGSNRWEFTGNGGDSTSGPGALGYQVSGWPAKLSTDSTSPNATGNKKNKTKSNSTNTDTTDVQTGPMGQTGLGVNNAVLTSWPTPDPESNMLLGQRAWINDVPVVETIVQLAQVSNRDIMSAPNGDFIAFFPDRTGANGKEPVVLIRDIEITDMNLEIHDDTLVTHYISVGSLSGLPLDPRLGFDYNLWFGGMVTLEMDELMKYLLGLEEDANFPAIGEWMLGRFGIRPKREEQSQVSDAGWNYCLALHRFQEFWASQWATGIGFTFMPEVFPGMRIELADHQLALYVEGLTHTGSRTGGWTTNLVVSTPMHKVGGKWKMLRAEWPVGLADAPETADTAEFLSPYNGYRGNEQLNAIVDAEWSVENSDSTVDPTAPTITD